MFKHRVIIVSNEDSFVHVDQWFQVELNPDLQAAG